MNNNWSLMELVPYIVSEANRLGIPLFAPGRECTLAAIIGARLNPYKARQAANLYGPSFAVTQVEIDAALNWLRKTEDDRRTTQKDLSTRPHRQDLGPMKIIPLNHYSRKSETREEEFYNEVIKRGIKIWDVVQICQSAFQVQVLEDSAFDDLALELANKATNDRIVHGNLQKV